jgi:hypothetical protein
MKIEMASNKEYAEWKNDPVAQAEYNNFLEKDLLKRLQLPDPFTTNSEQFTRTFFEIFGKKS